MKKQYIGKIAGLAIAAVVMASATANAALTFAFPMDYSSANIVGTAKGFNGDNAGNDASWLAQNILNVVGLNTSVTGAILDPSDPEPTRIYHSSSILDYTGTIQGLGSHVNTPGGSPFIPANTITGVTYDSVYVPAGYQYAVAKYDGKNAGWVLFALGGQDAYLPQLSQSFWGIHDGDYNMSGFTVFNPVPEPSTIIAGALLLLPFGASTIRMLRKNRTA